MSNNANLDIGDKFSYTSSSLLDLNRVHCCTIVDTH